MKSGRFIMSRLLLQYCAVVAVVWLFSVAPAAAQASADSDHDAAVLRIIEQFEQQPSSQLANRFMKVIVAEELSDEHQAFSDSTPTDSLRQQVYYWLPSGTTTASTTTSPSNMR